MKDKKEEVKKIVVLQQGARITVFFINWLQLLLYYEAQKTEKRRECGATGSYGIQDPYRI